MPVVVAVLGVVCVALFAGASGAAGQTGPTVEVHGASPDLVQVDQDVQVSYTANGSGITDDDVTLVFTHPHGDTYTFGGQNGTDIVQEVALQPANLKPGPYDVTVAVDGASNATLEDAFEVAPVYDPEDASFGTSASSTDGVVANYEGMAGDFVEVSVSLNDVDDAYLVIGGDRASDDVYPETPLDILHVSSSTTFVINTRLVGTDRPSEDVYIGSGVTSYAHDLGADKEPQGVFEGLQFETREYEKVADTLAEFRAEANVGPQERPLQPATYSMVIGAGDSMLVTEEGFPEPRYPLDRATIELTQPTLGEITTYRLPTGNADEVAFKTDPSNIQDLSPGDINTLLGMAEQTDTMVAGERLLLEVEATGMYGALFDAVGNPSLVSEGGNGRLITPDEFRTLLERPEGITFTMQHVNPDVNEQGTAVSLFDADSEDVVVIPDPEPGQSATEMDRFYVLVDTRNPGPFDPGVSGGQKYRIQMSYQSPAGQQYHFASTGLDQQSDPYDPANPPGPAGIYPYFGTDQTTQTRTVSVQMEAPFVEYDRTTKEGMPVVANASGATISGRTNLAPGSDLPVSIVIDVRNDPTKVEIDDITITENGTFSVQTDLTMLEAGAEVDIQFWAYQELLDERPLKVVGADEETARFKLTQFSTESIVTANETFAELTAVVTNTGLLEANKTVELLVDEEVLANRTVRLEAGESRALHFEDVMSNLSVGEYAIEVRTPDDRAGQLLVVENATGVFDVSALSASTTLTQNGTDVDFSTTIVNNGNINETGTVELLVDGEVVTERERNLLVGQSITYEFAEELSELDPGTYNLTVRTRDDEARTTLVVERAYARFNLTAVDATGTLTQGESLTVSALVNNSGTITDTASVELLLGGDPLDSSQVELGPDGNVTVTFNETAIDREPGEYNLTIRTPDDERTIRLVVEEAPSEDDDSTDDTTDEVDTEPPEDPGSDADDGPAGFLGIGIRRRAVIGGTALVATIHVLGYWI